MAAPVFIHRGNTISQTSLSLLKKMRNLSTRLILSCLSALSLLLPVLAQGSEPGEIIPGYGWAAYIPAGNTIPFSLTWDNGTLVVVGYVVVPQPPSTVAFASRLDTNGLVSSYVQWQGSTSDWVFNGDYSVTKRAAVILTQQVTTSFGLRGFYVDGGSNERSIQKTGGGLSVKYLRFVPGTEDLLVTGSQARPTSGNDILYIKLDADGATKVQTSFGSPQSDNGISVTAISAQETLVLSSVQGSFDAGNANLTTGSTNFALTRMNGDTRVWTRIWGSNGGVDTPKKVAYDPETQMIVVVGEVRQSVAGKPIIGDLDVLVTCFDRDGNRTWTQIFGATGEDTVFDVIIHPITKAIYVVGATTGTVEQGVIKSRDIFLAKLSPNNGTVLWTTTYGSSRDDYPVAMVLIPELENTLYITGHTRGNFLGKSNPTGNYQGFVFSVPLDKPPTTSSVTTLALNPTQTSTNDPRGDNQLSLLELIAKYMVWVVAGSIVLVAMLIFILFRVLRRSCNATNTIAKSWDDAPGQDFFGSTKAKNDQPFDVFSATTDSVVGLKSRYAFDASNSDELRQTSTDKPSQARDYTTMPTLPRGESMSSAFPDDTYNGSESNMMSAQGSRYDASLDRPQSPTRQQTLTRQPTIARQQTMAREQSRILARQQTLAREPSQSLARQSTLAREPSQGRNLASRQPTLAREPSQSLARQRNDYASDASLQRGPTRSRTNLDSTMVGSRPSPPPPLPASASQGRLAAQSERQLNSLPSRQAAVGGGRGGATFASSQSRFGMYTGTDGGPASRNTPLPMSPSFELPVYGQPATTISRTPGFEPPVFSSTSFPGFEEPSSSSNSNSNSRPSMFSSGLDLTIFRPTTNPLFTDRKVLASAASTPRLAAGGVGGAPSSDFGSRSATMRQATSPPSPPHPSSPIRSSKKDRSRRSPGPDRNAQNASSSSRQPDQPSPGYTDPVEDDSNMEYSPASSRRDRYNM